MNQPSHDISAADVFLLRRKNSELLKGGAALLCRSDGDKHVAGTQWGNKKYMNMKHLEAALDDVSVAG